MAKKKSTNQFSDYHELRAELRAGRFHSLYVLFGEEDFLIDKLVEALTELLLDKGSAALDRVVFNIGGQSAKLDAERLQAELMTPPFLSRRKLVIVRHSGWLSPGSAGQNLSDASESSDQEDEVPDFSGPTSKARQEQLAQMIRGLPDSACLVMIENKVDQRQKNLINLIQEKGVLAKIDREKPKTLQQWVVAECRRRQIKILPDAAESLIDRCDLSMQVIWQELQKLFLYCEGAGCRKVDSQLIGEISLPDLRGNIFTLTDAISDGQTEKALALVDTLLSQRQPIQLIQFMLTRHFRQLICAAELVEPAKITAQLKVMPFVAARLAGQAKRLPMDLLEALYAECFANDLLVKTSQINDRLALETLLISAAEMVKATVDR
ncbi:MAG: DNA polymerase III subunit delta [Clostridiaceae bacterium]|nr:DNA polymerase III subunit delta [Clostridiaceae bacterium]